MELKEKLASFRESKNWSKSQLAKALGVSSQLYGKYESGERTPKLQFYNDWLKAFKFDLKSYNPKQKETNVSRITIFATEEEKEIDRLQSKALIKVLLSRVAKHEAKIYGKPLDDVLNEIEDDTKIHLRELVKAQQ